MNPELKERTKDQISKQLLGLSGYKLEILIITEKLLRVSIIKILIKFFVRKLFSKLPPIVWISISIYVIYLLVTLW